MAHVSTIEVALRRMGVTRDTYEHLMKTHCAGCGNYIDPDIERYEHRGNFCQTCDRAVQISLKTTPADPGLLY
jgi:hypothetical protein